MRLLVVSRDSAVLRPVWSIVESSSWQLELASNIWEAMDRLQSGLELDIVLLDLPQSDADGLHSMRWLRRIRPALPIILIANPGNIGSQEESLHLGAGDYLIRPFEERQLELAIKRNLALPREVTGPDITSDDVESTSDGRFFVAGTPAMRKLRAHAAMLAETNASVLILGEDGSGKETLARLIHRLSVRSGFCFATVNCAALPADLLERELFGMDRDRTSQCTQYGAGKLERCAHGTILLNDVTEMPLMLQSRLVQVLQNKPFMKSGTEADVRVLAASSTNLDRVVAEKRFDENLYKCLTAYTIHLGPLRDRREEIPGLARHLMHRLSRQYCLPQRDISASMIEAWVAYNWPGNLPELEQSVKRYLMVGDNELRFVGGHRSSDGDVQVSAFKTDRAASATEPLLGQARMADLESRSLRSLIQSVKSETERNAIAVALERTGWNRKAAARLLKVSYRTVLYKIEQYKMTAANSAALPISGGNSVCNADTHSYDGSPSDIEPFHAVSRGHARS